jgi:hypothetical protein
MHEIHVLPKLCGEFSEMLVHFFAVPHASLSVTKQVKDASAHNQKIVHRNCGMWGVDWQITTSVLSFIKEKWLNLY